MIRRIGLLAIGLAIALTPVAVPAQETTALGAARDAGMIGERYDGYLGFATTPSATVRAQVNAINIKRRSLYIQLASRRGVTPAEVGLTAACTLLGRVDVGESYVLADNRWRRRAANEGAPRPDYCG